MEKLKKITLVNCKSKSVVYCAHNIINDKVYIGYTQQGLNNRKKTHYSKAKNNNTSNNYFHLALIKYKRDDFKWYIIYENDNLDKLKEMEKHYISEFNSNNRDFGYNLTNGGEQCYFNDEVKLKISKKAIERNLNGSNNPFFGKKHSEETKQKLSETRKGICYNPGYKHSEQTKQKLSKIRKEITKNPNVIDNMSKAQKNNKKIICINNGITYNSIGEAARSLNINKSGIQSQLKGVVKKYKGYEFKLVQ